MTPFSVRRALKKDRWSKKATQNVAQEHNPDLLDEYMHEISSFRSDQMVFIDESGVVRRIWPSTQIRLPFQTVCLSSFVEYM